MIRGLGVLFTVESHYNSSRCKPFMEREYVVGQREEAQVRQSTVVTTLFSSECQEIRALSPCCQHEDNKNNMGSYQQPNNSS